jgi:hypothetical protein
MAIRRAYNIIERENELLENVLKWGLLWLSPRAGIKGYLMG